jgi:hypothetical protein
MGHDLFLKSSFPVRSLLTLALLLVFMNAGCEESIVVSQYDPDRAWDGYTYFIGWEMSRIVRVDMEGIVGWDFQVPGSIEVGKAHGFRVKDGTVAYASMGRPILANLEDEAILFEGPYLGAHHSIVITPAGTLLFVAEDVFDVNDPSWYVGSVRGDVLREIDTATAEIVWEWRLRDYVDPVEHHNPDWMNILYGSLDWSHGNTVKFFPQYFYDGLEYRAVLYHSLSLETFWMIDYDTLEVIWSCGQHGTFGRRDPPEEALFSGAHEVDMVENDVFIMYDNGIYRQVQRSRALKIQVDPIAGTAEELWSWSYWGMFDGWGGDADELPNGNVLFTNVLEGRIIEVTPDGEIVWDMRFLNPLHMPYTIYQLQRVLYDS